MCSVPSPWGGCGDQSHKCEAYDAFKVSCEFLFLWLIVVHHSSGLGLLELTMYNLSDQGIIEPTGILAVFHGHIIWTECRSKVCYSLQGCFKKESDWVCLYKVNVRPTCALEHLHRLIGKIWICSNRMFWDPWCIEGNPYQLRTWCSSYCPCLGSWYLSGWYGE